jgi:membrane protein
VGIIVLMLYIYWSSYILLLGAEMNQIIEEHAPEGKDEGEKVSPEQRAEKAAT